MKPVVFLFVATLFFVEGQSQANLPGSYPGYSLPYYNSRNFSLPDSASTKKWSISKYGGISTSFIGWKGGYATAVSAPFGIQLNRKLNNNLFAFAGLSVAPTYVNFNQAFLNGGMNNKSFQGNSFMYRPNNFGIYPRAELGLMYTNDERTFQISGSVGVERRSFPDVGNFQRLNRINNIPAGSK